MADNKTLSWDEYYEYKGVPEYARKYPENTTTYGGTDSSYQAQDYSNLEPKSTYWHDPTNVAKYYNQIQTNQYEDWMDDSFVDFIQQAYGLYEIANDGANWENWKPLQLSDPARDFLASFDAPPVELAEQQETKPYPDLGEQNYTTGGLTQEQWDALPWAQKALYKIFSTPQTAGAAIGGTLGLAGGPVGAAVGAGLGAGLGTLADRFPWLAGAFDKLDILAEGVERFLGATSLVTTGEVQSFKDLEAAWKAGHLTYDVARLKDEQIGELLEQPKVVEWTDDELIYEAYDRIRKGEDVNKVYESIQERTGFSGQMRDLMGHIIFDPLNFAGAFALKGGGALVKLGVATSVLGDAYRPLSTAFDMAKGITDVIPNYANELRNAISVSGDVKDALKVSDLNGIQRWMAQYDKAGVDIKYAKTKEITGVAGVANKLGGAIATGGITSVIGAGLFGLPGAVIVGGIGSLFGYRRGISYMAHLTPAAKSLTTLDDVTHSIANVVSHNTSIVDGVKQLDHHAYAKHLHILRDNPHQLSAELSMRMFDTPDAAAIPLFLKGSVDKIDELVDLWDTTAGSRKLLRNMSDATGKSVDDLLKMMRESGKKMKKGTSDVTPDVDKLDVLVKMVEDSARKSNNTEMLKLIDEGGFTKDTLADMFKTFIKDDAAATENAWLAKSTGILLEDVAVNAAKWFDVKPEASVIRMSNALKNAQSLVLLGLNPNYLVNNFVNNMVTMASDGVLGFRTTKAIDAFWARVGVEPPRLRQGVTALGDTDVGNQAILDAMRKGDWIDKFGSGAANKTQQWGIFAKGSQGVEAWSSAQALTSGFKRAWSKIWKPGKGFDVLPQEYQNFLGPELTNYVHSSIRNGMNKAEIEEALWSGYVRKSADDFIPGIAEKMWMREDDVRGVLRDLHIDEFLRDGIKDSATDADIAKVFEDAYKMVDTQLDKMLEQHTEFMAEHLKNRFGIEGSVPFVDILAKNSIRLELAEIERWASNERVWELLKNRPDLDNKTKAALWREHYQRQRTRYGRYEKESIAELKAVVESIDGADDLGRMLVDSEKGWHDNWREYYKLLDELQKKMFKEKGDPEIAFDKYEAEALQLYKKHVIRENEIEVAINGAIEQMIRRQHGDKAGDATIEWRTKMIKMRQEMRTDMIILREQLRGKSHAERAQMWRDFIKPHMKKIDDYHNANFDDANGVYDATRAAGNAQTTPNAGVSMPLGFGDKFMPSPSLYDIFENGWSEMAVPLLDELRNAMLGQDAKYGTNLKGANLSPDQISKIKGYLNTQYGKMADAKNSAIRYGEQARDFALLNYQRRTGLDTMLTAVMPYQFWYGRSMINWARRALDRPGYIATWGRLHAAQQQNERKEGYPTRLAGKIQIEMPFLPEWMGDSLYIDPMRQAFPIELLLEPFQAMAEDRNAIDSRVRYILEQWYADDKYEQTALQEALDNREGAIWDEAVAQAKVEVEREFSNPMDFMTAISGTLLPIEWAYQLINGRKDKIGSLPVTRAIQALTSWAKPGGVNIEAPLRKALGLPVDGNEYMDYYIRREIPWVGIMGGYSMEEIQNALVDRTGPLYEMALDYVGKRQSLRYFSSSISLDFFPEGEQEMRALGEEFSAAIEANQLSEFYDRHPEYASRSMSYMEDPEDIIRKIAISAIWTLRQEVPGLTKNRLDAAFGEEFQMSFLDKETRSYDAIDTETLLSWAQALGAELPEKAKEYNIPAVMADTGSPAENEIYDWYYDEREKLFGEDIAAVNKRFFALPKENQKAFKKLHPELELYWDWNRGIKQQYPRLAELTSEKYERDNLAEFEIDPKDFSAPLTNRLLGYFYSAQPLGSGTRSELNRLWVKYDKPTKTLDEFIELLRSYIYNQ